MDGHRVRAREATRGALSASDAGREKSEIALSKHANGPRPRPITTQDWVSENDNRLYLDLNGTTPMVSGYYKHDCFPAHELWIGNTQIHGYMPPSNDFATLARCLAGVGQIEGRIAARAIPAGQ